MKSGGQESQFRNKKNNWWRDTELINESSYANKM
jgi:hypothetical protein